MPTGVNHRDIRSSVAIDRLDARSPDIDRSMSPQRSWPRVHRDPDRVAERIPSLGQEHGKLEREVPARIVARRKTSLIFLTLDEVWAIEAANRLAFVHSPFGRFDLDLTLASIEAIWGPLLMRVHRNWLVNVAHIRELGRERGATTLYLGIGSAKSGKGVCAPVARERARQVRDALLSTAAGIRRP